MSVRILFCGTGWLDIVPRIASALAARGIEAAIAIRDPGKPLREQLADVDVALPSNARFGADDLAAAPRLALIQQPAVGHEGIDVVAARARGVPVCNAPGSNTDSVAQAALLLILALARRFRSAQTAFAHGIIGGPLGTDLSGRTLGVIGMGRTGTRLAEITRSIGMTVSSVGRHDTPEALLALLGRADVVSLHAPLTERTRCLLDDRAFAAMKPGALLVNVARGGLVDRGALERALASGRLGGVGLDVFWEEPWDPDDPLYARDDVIVLPHIAGSTDESFARIADIVAGNIAALVRHEPFSHRVDG